MGPAAFDVISLPALHRAIGHCLELMGNTGVAVEEYRNAALAVPPMMGATSSVLTPVCHCARPLPRCMHSAPASPWLPAAVLPVAAACWTDP